MEFQNSFETKEQVLAYWEKGWACVFNAIDPLTIEEANKIVYIRNEGHSILEALNRQLGHYSYHIGQIVFLGKTLKGKDWQSLSIPVGQSTTFNSEKFGKEKSRKNFV
jgi:predicted SprT family Zn-dependent metalloprotease